MDGEGYVPISVIAGFNRVRSLTNDVNLIREVCLIFDHHVFICCGVQALMTSAVLELNEADQVRKKEDWQNWILPADQRLGSEATPDASAVATGEAVPAEQSTA